MSDLDLIDTYLAGIKLLQQAGAGLQEQQLQARPADGSWSILEILCHLADSEALFAERMKRVLAEDCPPLPRADPDRYMAALACHARNAAEELALIAAVRNQMARILRAQPAEAWQRVGIHSQEGERTLEQLVRKAIDHLEHHLEFLHAKRKAIV